jgi:ADP-ribosylglycohydrolase
VGDALGTTLEFQTPRAPLFPLLCEGPHRDVTGGGPFGVLPGQVTDDTQMACALAESLAERRGFDADDVAARYLAWLPHAFDAGAQTSAALARIGRGEPPHEAARAVWEGSGRRAAGNGSLMRAAPIAVLLDDVGLRREAALGDAAVSHFDPRCRLAGAAWIAALGALVDGASPIEAFGCAVRELDEAAALLRARELALDAQIGEARRALASDLARSAARDPELYGPELHLQEMEGFVRVAFRLAFWHLRHGASYEAALIDVVNRGGDADTNGAITGALLGASQGEDAIPERWRAAVLAAAPADAVLAGRLHPRALMAWVP